MKRRNFLKLLGVGAAVVAIPVIPTFETSIYSHPEVRAVLNRFPDVLLEQEKLAIANFVMTMIKDDQWNNIDAYYSYWLTSKQNCITNWVNEKD